MKRLEKYLQENHNSFFGFAYSLLSDDLQAQQLVVDAVYVLTLKSKDLLEAYLQAQNQLDEEFAKLQIKKFILKQIYLIGRKRVAHLGKTLVADEKYKAYYHLNYEERACLFLKHKMVFALNDISEITGVSDVELVTTLARARKSLMDKIGLNVNELMA